MSSGVVRAPKGIHLPDLSKMFGLFLLVQLIPIEKQRIDILLILLAQGLPIKAKILQRRTLCGRWGGSFLLLLTPCQQSFEKTTEGSVWSLS
jgi:hypothetical protein